MNVILYYYSILFSDMQAILPEYADKTLGIQGNTAQFGGASGSVFSAICGV